MSCNELFSSLIESGWDIGIQKENYIMFEKGNRIYEVVFENNEVINYRESEV